MATPRMEVVNNCLKIVQKFVSLCLPCHCILCLSDSKRNIPLCVACERLLPFLKQTCVRCALPLNSTQPCCGACLQTSTVGYDNIYALFDYQWPVDIFISHLKYRKKHYFATLLGTLMANKMTCPTAIDCIIPMPLHPRRQRQRGFNQTIELAKVVAKKWGLPLDLKSCLKKIDTVQQSSLSAKQRIGNISSDMFSINSSFKAKRVLVIEDVVTTSTTVQAFSTALKQNGVESVEILSCCRTILTN